ncbi:unnamed protein product [Arctogadus glacialis]
MKTSESSWDFIEVIFSETRMGSLVDFSKKKCMVWGQYSCVKYRVSLFTGKKPRDLLPPIGLGLYHVTPGLKVRPTPALAQTDPLEP